MSLIDRLSKGLGDSIRESRSTAKVPDSGRGRGRGRGRGARGGRHSDGFYGPSEDGARRIVPISTVSRRVWRKPGDAEGSGRGRGRGRELRGRSNMWSRGRGRNLYNRLERLPDANAEESDGSDNDEDYEEGVDTEEDEEDAPQGFFCPGRYREDGNVASHDEGGGSTPPRARVVMRQVASPADTQSKAALENKSKLPPNGERRGPLPGIICLCNTRTLADIIRRSLCGLPRSFQAVVNRISPDTAVFLYNFQTKELHGVYEAKGENGENLDPTAFGGSAKGGSPYAAQFRISTAKRTLPIQYATFKDIISYRSSKHFELELTESQVCTLRGIFERGLSEELKKERRKARFAPLEPVGDKGTTQAREEEPAPSTYTQDISLDVESFLSGYFLTEDPDDDKEEEECAEKQPGQAELDAVPVAAAEGGDEVSVVQDNESSHNSDAAADVEQKPLLSRMRPAPLMVLDAGSVSQKPLLGAPSDSAVPKWTLDDSGKDLRTASGVPDGLTDKGSPAAQSQQGKQIRPRSEPNEPEGDANNATINVELEDSSGLRRRRSRSVSSGLLVSECGTDDYDFSGPPSSKAPGASRAAGSHQEPSRGSYGYKRPGSSDRGSHLARPRPQELVRPVRGSFARGPFDRMDHGASAFNDRGPRPHHHGAPDGAYPSRSGDSRISPSLTDSSLMGSLRRPPPAGAYSDPDSDFDDRDSADTLRRRRLPPPGRDEQGRRTWLPATRNRDDFLRYGRENEPRRDDHSYDPGRDRGPPETIRGRYLEDEDERAFKRRRGLRDEYEGPRRPYPDHRPDLGFRRGRPDFQEEAPRYREDIPMRRSPSPPHPMGRRNSPPRRPLDGWADRRPEERSRHDNVRDIRPSGALGGRCMGSPGYHEDRDRGRPWQYQGGRGRGRGRRG